jgi:hypothetical protein
MGRGHYWMCLVGPFERICTHGSCPHTCGGPLVQKCPLSILQYKPWSLSITTSKRPSGGCLFGGNKSTIFLYYSRDCGDGHVCTAITNFLIILLRIEKYLSSRSGKGIKVTHPQKWPPSTINRPPWIFFNTYLGLTFVVVAMAQDQC